MKEAHFFMLEFLFERNEQGYSVIWMAWVVARLMSGKAINKILFRKEGDYHGFHERYQETPQ